MELKNLNKDCPVCESAVFGQRSTRIYCGENCKAEHHSNARNQIMDRVWEEVDRDYIQLFSRNLYLFDSVLGPNYQSFKVNLKEFKSQKFQLTECSLTTKVGDTTIYYLSNYKYWTEGEILHVERIFAGPAYNDFVTGRWLMEYPDFSDADRFTEMFEGAELEEFKNLILENGYVWRE